MANEMIKETEQVMDQEIVMALSIDRVMGLLLIGVTMLISFSGCIDNQEGFSPPSAEEPSPELPIVIG